MYPERWEECHCSELTVVVNLERSDFGPLSGSSSPKVRFWTLEQ